MARTEHEGGRESDQASCTPRLRTVYTGMIPRDAANRSMLTPLERHADNTARGSSSDRCAAIRSSEGPRSLPRQLTVQTSPAGGLRTRAAVIRQLAPMATPLRPRPPATAEREVLSPSLVHLGLPVRCPI